MLFWTKDLAYICADKRDKLVFSFHPYVFPSLACSLAFRNPHFLLEKINLLSCKVFCEFFLSQMGQKTVIFKPVYITEITPQLRIGNKNFKFISLRSILKIITLKWQQNVFPLSEPSECAQFWEPLLGLLLHLLEQRSATKWKSSKRITIISFISHKFMDWRKQLLSVKAFINGMENKYTGPVIY